MAFSLSKFDKLSSAGNQVVRTLWAYTDAAETLATLAASAFFNDVIDTLTVGDSVYMLGSDGNGQYEITSVTTNVTMAAATDPGALSETLADGDIFVGNGSNIATAVTMSGDITTTNAGVTTIGAAAVDSSMMNANMLRYAAVTVSAAQFNGAYAAPHLLVAAAGANTLLVLESCQMLMTYGTAQFAAGGVSHIQYDSTANGAGIIASSTQIAADYADAASTANGYNQGIVKQPFATCVNKGLYFSNITGAFTTGDSTLVAHIWYREVPSV